MWEKNFNTMYENKSDNLKLHTIIKNKLVFCSPVGNEIFKLEFVDFSKISYNFIDFS